MKLKIVLLLLVLAVLSIAADSYPISDWRVLWQFPDANNCGIVDGVPLIKTTWVRDIMRWSEVHGWYKTIEAAYTCNGLPPTEVDPELSFFYLPMILEHPPVTSSIRP